MTYFQSRDQKRAYRCFQGKKNPNLGCCQKCICLYLQQKIFTVWFCFFRWIRLSQPQIIRGKIITVEILQRVHENVSDLPTSGHGTFPREGKDMMVFWDLCCCILTLGSFRKIKWARVVLQLRFGKWGNAGKALHVVWLSPVPAGPCQSSSLCYRHRKGDRKWCSLTWCHTKS